MLKIGLKKGKSPTFMLTVSKQYWRYHVFHQCLLIKNIIYNLFVWRTFFSDCSGWTPMFMINGYYSSYLTLIVSSPWMVKSLQSSVRHSGAIKTLGSKLGPNKIGWEWSVCWSFKSSQNSVCCSYACGFWPILTQDDPSFGAITSQPPGLQIDSPTSGSDEWWTPAPFWWPPLW